MACNEKAMKRCKEKGGQPTWNQSKQRCFCEGIAKDEQGKSIRVMKKGKPHSDAFGNPVYKTTGYSLGTK